MTRKKRRVIIILIGMAILSAAVGLVGWALQSKITFFKSPSEVIAGSIQKGERFRLGGLVETGTFHKQSDAAALFTVTDGNGQVHVQFKGILPDLFREGQGVVAEGVLNAEGIFIADTVLAKHDEKYMPREVADALRKNGHWRETDKPQNNQPGS